MTEWTEGPVSIQVEGWLAGTLCRPRAGTGAAVVMVPGSGPVDRDGNLPGVRNDAMRLLAHGLAARGIASIRFDKRGVGASAAAGAEEAALRFGTYVRDAIAWAEALRGVPGVTAVSLLGHSEGALVATLAARRAEAARLVLLAGAGSPAGTLLARQFAEAGLPEEVQAELRRVLAELSTRHAVADVQPPLTEMFRASVQPYLMSWLPIDPAHALSRVEAPVLVVQGTADIQVSVSDARILAAARPGTELRLVEGMNHVLKAAPMERGANMASYNRPELPLAPGLEEAVADWLLGRNGADGVVGDDAR